MPFLLCICLVLSHACRYAIDSLKQLSLKFMRKDERREFTFQRLFLTPFVTILKESQEQQKNGKLAKGAKKSKAEKATADGNQSLVRELVVQVLGVIIRQAQPQLKSGWRALFDAFTIAAADTQSVVVDSALTFVTQCVTGSSRLVENKKSSLTF